MVRVLTPPRQMYSAHKNIADDQIYLRYTTSRSTKRHVSASREADRETNRLGETSQREYVADQGPGDVFDRLLYRKVS